MKKAVFYTSILALAFGLSSANASNHDHDTKPIKLCNESGLCSLQPVNGQLAPLCVKDFCTLHTKDSKPIKLCSPSGLCELIKPDSDASKNLEPLCKDKDFCKLMPAKS